MRNILFIASLLFAVCANAQQNPFQSTTNATSLPTSYSLISTLATGYNNRGVADIEQMRDELPALHADILVGAAKEIADIRQPALKELFEDIAKNDETMAKIHAAHPGKTDLVAITLAVAADLL